MVGSGDVSDVRETLVAMRGVVDEIAAERLRQVEQEGWTAEHDDAHIEGQLSRAASHYAAHASAYSRVFSDVTLAVYRICEPVPSWPWLRGWWKPTTPRRDLVKAAALIVAEIERLDRIAAQGDGL